MFLILVIGRRYIHIGGSSPVTYHLCMELEAKIETL